MARFEGFWTEAVKLYWATRTSSSGASAGAYAGRRSEVVGGKHTDGFYIAIRDLLTANGVDAEHIFVSTPGFTSPSTIPGFFRPNKNWDMVVVRDGQLLAAIEIKSQSGSVGNNYNNRCEEAIGNATDLSTWFREEGFKHGEKPFLGYVFMLEDTPATQTPVRVHEPHFSVFPEFRKASYCDRYHELCRRLVAEELYTAALFLMSRPDEVREQPNYREAEADIGTDRFLEALLRRVVPL